MFYLLQILLTGNYAKPGKIEQALPYKCISFVQAHPKHISIAEKRELDKVLPVNKDLNTLPMIISGGSSRNGV
jgi:hypothetical protein